MNLPHIQHNNVPAKPLAKLGPKSLRAINQPIVATRGRKTLMDPMTLGTAGFDGTLPLPDPTSSWRTLEVQRKNLLNLPYTSLSTLALDLSPQINKGLWDFVLFGNPGYVIDDVSDRAIQSNEEFMKEIGCYYGNMKNHIDSMWADIYVYGAVFPELVLGPGGRGGVDIALNNPLSGRFRYAKDALRGDIYELGQETLRGFISHQANRLVRYIGFGRVGNNPYGRPLIAPGVHASLFLLGLISDLRRLIANQGISRQDYSLDQEQLLALIDRNADIAGDDEATAQFINEHIEMVKETISDLDIDQDYVHLSTVEVNYSTNRIQTNMNGLDQLIETLKVDVVNGIKSIAALSNIMNSTTETHITRQLEYYVSSISSVQEELADMLSDFLTINNLSRGIRSEAKLQFKKQRTTGRRETAEIRKIETDTVINKLDAGIIDETEAKEELDSFQDQLVVNA